MKVLRSAVSVISILVITACQSGELPQSQGQEYQNAPVQKSTDTAQFSSDLGSEGRHALMTITNGLKDFRLDSGSFTSNIEDLGLAITPDTSTYTYEIIVQDPKSFAYVTVVPTKPELVSFVSGIFLEPGHLAFAWCVSNAPSQARPAAPIQTAKTIKCPDGFTEW